jgi:HK97 family phage prohead protease
MHTLQQTGIHRHEGTTQIVTKKECFMYNRIYTADRALLDIVEKRGSDQAPSMPPVLHTEDTQKASGRKYTFTISTASVDRSNDSIDPAGWDLRAYKKNPVVLWAHDARQWPVGTATSTYVEGGRLKAQMVFADTHEGRKAEHLVQTGHLRATSVGFRPLEHKLALEPGRNGGIDFKKQELMEFSIVPVPCNGDCLIERSPKEQLAAFRAGDRANKRKAEAEKLLAAELKRQAYEIRRAKRAARLEHTPDDYTPEGLAMQRIIDTRRAADTAKAMRAQRIRRYRANVLRYKGVTVL